MKPAFIILLFLSLFSGLMAQDEIVVSGRIMDVSVNQGLPYASVSLKIRGEDQLIAGAITEEDGRFVFSGIERGEYLLTCSYVGYGSVSLELLVGELNDIYDLGKISLQPVSSELDEVIISSNRSVTSADLDRKTYRVDDNFAQSGGSVLDAMKTMPGVTVDQEGRVLIRGSDRVAVLIDGKQSSLTGFGNQKGLDNIPVANIERIEIINNPSARYDAAGMAGIINLVYKKEDESGFNADAGFTFGMGAMTKGRKDLPTDLGSYSWNPKYIPSLNMNYKTSNVNLFIMSELIHQRSLPNNEYTTREYEDGTGTVSQVPENRRQIRYIINGGLDWLIDDENTLTFSTIYDYESHTDTAQVPYIDLYNWRRYRFWTWRESEVTGFMNFTLNYKHKFVQPGHEVNAIALYTRGWEDESYYLNDSSMIRQSTDTTHILATEHTASLTVDYIKPLRNGRLEAGSKLMFRRIPVTYTVGQGEQSIIYPGLGEWSEWGENNYAAYLNYVYERPKYDIEAGMRVEHTDVFYDISPENIYYDQSDAYQYFELFPNIRVTYKFNEQNRVSAFYNRRIDRPAEPELRIFPKYDDPELLKVGNPYLRPQFTQTYELAYRRKWASGLAAISGYYRSIRDPFMRVYGIDTTSFDYDVVNKIYQNTGKANHTGIELVLEQQLKDWWELTASANAYKNVIQPYTGILLFPYRRPFSIDRTVDKTWDIKISNQFSLSGQWEVQITGIYFAPKNIPQGRQLSRSSVDLGIRKKVIQGKGDIILNFSDIFNHFGVRHEISGDGVNILYENYYETQVLRIGFRYKF